MKIKPPIFWLVLALCILVSNVAYSDTKLSINHTSQLAHGSNLWGFTIGVQSTENPYFFLSRGLKKNGCGEEEEKKKMFG